MNSTTLKRSTDKTESRERKGTLSSGIRCLQILRLLSAADEDMALQDVASATNLHPSTAHRILATLVSDGFVEQEPDRRYRLGIEAFAVGVGFLRRSVVRRSAVPHLVKLVQNTKASVSLALWHRGRVVVLDCIPLPGMYNFYTETGSFVPPHATGLGKVLLAFRKDPPTREITLTRYTPNTIRTTTALEKEIEKVRRAGYAIDDEECMLGCRCIAAPVFQTGSDAVAAISISAPPAMLPMERIPKIVPIVKESAMQISLQAGYRPIGNPPAVY